MAQAWTKSERYCIGSALLPLFILFISVCATRPSEVKWSKIGQIPSISCLYVESFRSSRKNTNLTSLNNIKHFESSFPAFGLVNSKELESLGLSSYESGDIIAFQESDYLQSLEELVIWFLAEVDYSLAASNSIFSRNEKLTRLRIWHTPHRTGAKSTVGHDIVRIPPTSETRS